MSENYLLLQHAQILLTTTAKDVRIHVFPHTKVRWPPPREVLVAGGTLQNQQVENATIINTLIDLRQAIMFTGLF